MKKILHFVVLFVFFLCGCGLSDKKAAVKKDEGNAAASALSQYPLAPNFSLSDLGGNEVVLSSFKDKQSVVLFFWTTWCPYCRYALRDLQQEYSAWEKAGVVVLAINVGENKSKVVNFVKSQKFGFRVFADTDYKVSDSYELMGVPVYYLINKDGRVTFIGNHFPKEKLKEIANV